MLENQLIMKAPSHQGTKEKLKDFVSWWLRGLVFSHPIEVISVCLK